MTTFTFPTLYGTDLKHQVKVWNAMIQETAEGAESIISYGHKDGKQQTSVVKFTSGKNIGRSNETTPYEQCRMETERKWKNQKEKKHYSESVATVTTVADPEVVLTADATVNVSAVVATVSTGSDSDSEVVKTKSAAYVTPMLAKTWAFPKAVTANGAAKPKKTDILFPCCVQPKLDGLRCMVYLNPAGTRVIYQSRTGGEFEGLEHIGREVESTLRANPTWVLDGELYTPEFTFEELVGLIKRKTRTKEHWEKLKKVEYHVYDMHDPQQPEAPFVQRMENLCTAFSAPKEASRVGLAPGLAPVQLVETPDAANPEEVRGWFGEFIGKGHEGIMLRNRAGPYVPNHRSYHLQKYKEFMEEEFPIVGYMTGVGKFQDCVTWVCSYDKGTFQVVPRGTLEQKRQWYADGDSYIGKQLTVIFQQKMESGCPRFPVGKAIRDGY